MRRALVLGLLLPALAGCAARQVGRAEPPLVDLGAADTLFHAGCYTCLREAFDLYSAALTASSAETARQGAFSTALLLGVREKELGLEARAWLRRAADLATTDEARALEIAEALPWTSAGASIDFDPASRPAPALQAQWQTALASAPLHAVARSYLAISAACTFGRRADATAVIAAADLTPPALRYRAGLCGADRRPDLEAVVTADPRFVEAWFFIGRYEMSAGVTPAGAAANNREWLTRAVGPLAAAHAGLPEAPIVTIVFAGLMRSRGELGRALALYDEALAVRPSQADALLGRTITLSYLSRTEAAIASATRLIELGVWYVSDAYYWRASNHYQRRELDRAAADIANARRLQVSEDVMTLSGLVAYDQDRPADARADFEGALTLNLSRCVAHWYLGMLDVEEERWRPAVDRFSTAATCYQQAAESMRADAALLPPDLPEEARQQQQLRYDQDIASSLRQVGRSFFNAAQASLRIGDRTSARTFGDEAARYEEMKERAEALLRSLGPPRD